MLSQLALDATTAMAPVADLVAAVPSPGGGEAPPGAETFGRILKWAAWLAFAVCVLGVIVTGATMAIASRDGRGGEHGARLVWVLGGCIVIGSASGLVTQLVPA